MNDAANRKLGRRVFAADAPHIFAAPHLRNGIRHVLAQATPRKDSFNASPAKAKRPNRVAGAQYNSVPSHPPLCSPYLLFQYFPTPIPEQLVFQEIANRNNKIHQYEAL